MRDKKDFTPDILMNLIKDNNIPGDVFIATDSGWECGPTEVSLVFYSPSRNVLMLTREGSLSVLTDYENHKPTGTYIYDRQTPSDIRYIYRREYPDEDFAMNYDDEDECIDRIASEMGYTKYTMVDSIYDYDEIYYSNWKLLWNGNSEG